MDELSSTMFLCFFFIILVIIYIVLHLHHFLIKSLKAVDWCPYTFTVMF